MAKVCRLDHYSVFLSKLRYWMPSEMWCSTGRIERTLFILDWLQSSGTAPPGARGAEKRGSP